MATAATVSPSTMTFVKLVTEDPEGLLPFYEKVFHFKVVSRSVANEGTEWALEEILTHADNDEGCTLVLLRFHARPNAKPGGIVLGMRVVDIEETLRRALECGATLVRPLVTMEKHGVKVAFVEDPGGNLVEVIQLLA